MVIAALISFGLLLAAWLVAPSRRLPEARREDGVPQPALTRAA